ncbi:SH3 domain-containing protein [Helicobacter cinaedi]|uniref:SH3 domain-containing protein n=1 Tax=Helicobacter cinaedi TaxID=213 RepID=UPI000CF17246|nr:SH3 domain-containing protein [Helicobacter cinaedi]
MNTRKFFKLYSLPFLIVALGVGLYIAVIMLIEQQDFVIGKRPNSVYQGNSQIAGAESPHISKDTHKEIDETYKHIQKDSHKKASSEADSIKNIESTPQVVEPQETNPQAVIVDNTQATAPLEQVLPSQVLPSQLPSSQASSQKYGYAKYRINIRQTPSSESAIISRAAVGETLEILSDEKDGWSKVKSRFGVEGYVASRLLAQNLDSQNGEPYVVVANTLNVRLKADSQGAVIGRLSHNMRVYVLETQGDWAKIQLPNKQYGYISLHHISKSVQ